MIRQLHTHTHPIFETPQLSPSGRAKAIRTVPALPSREFSLIGRPGVIISTTGHPLLGIGMLDVVGATVPPFVMMT